MILPTVIIAGAQKSGTTTLRDVLAQHPDVFMSSPKELHFFDRHYDRGLDWYASCFEQGRHHAQRGESSPFYMYNTTARERMVATLPDLRVICILRNPVTRAYSHYWHAREKGPEKSATFEEALEREPRKLLRSKDGKPAVSSYVDRGRYLEQLLPIADAVGRDRLHVLLMDDLTDQPQESTRSIFRFLEVDPSPADRISVGVANAFGGGESSRQGEARDRPERDRGELPTGRYPPMAAETRERLRETFEPLNQQLGEWLGRDLSHWR